MSRILGKGNAPQFWGMVIIRILGKGIDPHFLGIEDKQVRMGGG